MKFCLNYEIGVIRSTTDMKKLIISALLATVLCAGSINNIVSAEEPLKISVGTAKASYGEKFSLDIRLNDIPADGFAACEMAIGYPEDLVEITSVKRGSISDTGAEKVELAINPKISSNASSYSCFNSNIVDGQICVTWNTGLANTDFWIKNSGVFFTVEGIVKAENSETIDFTVEPIFRETYPYSKVRNEKIIFGYRDTSFSSVKEYFYDFTTEDGTLEIEQKRTLAGDANLDNNVSIFDLLLTVRAVTKTADLSEVRTLNADVISDGIVDVKDLMRIAKYIAGVENSLD